MDTDIQKLSQTINEVKTSVAKEIDLPIGLKMANSIENRAKAEVQKHLNFLSPEKNHALSGAGGAPDDPHDSDEDSEDEDDAKGPKPEENDDFEYLPELVDLPPTTYKSKRLNRRSSFYNKRSTFEYPKSPLDVEFKVGCNDDLFSTSTSSSKSLDSKQRKASNVCKQWMNQLRQKPTFAKVNTSTTPLKRSPLPSSVTWSGKGAGNLKSSLTNSPVMLPNNHTWAIYCMNQLQPCGLNMVTQKLCCELVWLRKYIHLCTIFLALNF